MENKKIRNASKIEVDGVVLKSKSEATMYRLLKQTGLRFDYEYYTITLMKGFYPRLWINGLKKDTTKVRDITYTPDFVVYGEERLYLIEVKGFPNDVYPLKRKLLLQFLMETNSIFFEVHTGKEMENCINIIMEYEKSCAKDK